QIRRLPGERRQRRLGQPAPRLVAALGERLELLLVSGAGQRQAGAAIRHDMRELLDAADEPGGVRRLDRHRQRTELGAGEKSQDEIEARRIDEQRGLAETQPAALGERESDLVAALVQATVAVAIDDLAAAVEKAIESIIGLPLHPTLEVPDDVPHARPCLI